jgi:two-component system sensor histidine kinase UhpB
MIRLRPRSVAVLLTGLAVMPTLVVAMISAIGIYLASTAEIEADVRSRGALTARALAETARYAVISGDANELQDRLRALLDADPTLLAIDVLDAAGQSVAQVSAGDADGRSIAVTEAIRVTPARADLFESGGPSADGSAARASPTAAGQVNVLLHTGPLERERARRLLLALLAIAAAAGLALAAALAMASRVRRPLRTVVQALRDIERGQYHVDLGEPVPGEVGELQRRIQKMAIAIQAARTDLESAVQTRTAELNEALDRLTLAANERRRLIARNDASIEAERKRVAKDIHDSLGSSLVLLKLLAENMREQASAADGDERAALARLREQAGRIEAAAAAAYASSRAIAKAMRPEAIDTMGLARAIEDLVHEYDAAAPACAFTVEVAPDVPDVRGEVAIIVYRVTQEALANILKHAEASHAAVTMRMEGEQLRLQVQDDGWGFPANAAASDRGLGLIGMRERVQAVGGTLTVASGFAAGTTVTASLPLVLPNTAGPTTTGGGLEGPPTIPGRL